MESVEDLILFGQVARFGGFAAASRALGIPKSRVSRRIALLEQRLGLRLIQRDSRHFHVTDVGLSLQQRCRAIEDELDRADAFVREALDSPKGVLRVTCPIPLATSWLSPILPDFLFACPDVQVRLEAVARRVDLIEERVDVALRVRKGNETEPDVVARRLFERKPMIVARRGAFKGPFKSPADLEGLPAAHYGPALWTLTGPDGVCLKADVRSVFVTNEVTSLLAIVKSGAAIGILNPEEICNGLANDELVQLLPEWTPHSIGDVQIAFPSRRGMVPAVRAFIDFLAAQPPPSAALPPHDD
jgi:DNA-binding transcriptional LysR family regulator